LERSFLRVSRGAVYLAALFALNASVTSRMIVNLGQSVVRVAATTGLLIFALSGSVAGQRIDSPYRFVDTKQSAGLFGGYIFASEGSIGLGPESGPVFGGRYGIRLSGPFTIEADIGYFPSTRAVLDTVPGEVTFTTIGEADLTLLLARGALRFNLTGPRTWHSMQPFVVFGGGVVIDLSSEAAVEDNLPQDARFDFGTSFAGELGAGVELFFSRRLALRLDGRNVLWQLEAPIAFLLGDRALTVPDQEWAQNFYLSAGLSIQF
jgi:hypothetical protein